MTGERWFTVKEIAEEMRVDEQTVRRWLRSGKLRGKPIGGRTGWRVRETDLRAFQLGEQDGRRTAA